MTNSRLVLRVHRGEAIQKIRACVEEGKRIGSLPMDSREAVLIARREEHKWSDLNKDILRGLFANEGIISEMS